MLQRVAVNHYYGWIHPPLMGVTEFGAVHARPLWALELHGLQQEPGQHRRGHLAIGRFVGLHNGRPKGTQSLPLLRRDQMHSGKFQKRQTRFDRAFHQFTLVIVHGIPLVHCHHDGPSVFQGITSDVGILIGHTLSGVDQQ